MPYNQPMYILTLLFFFFSYSDRANSSCAGVEGCDECYSIQVVPEPKITACKTSPECIAIADGCGGFTAVNKNYASWKVNKIRPSCGKIPFVSCRSGQCLVTGKYEKNMKETCP